MPRRPAVPLPYGAIRIGERDERAFLILRHGHLREPPDNPKEVRTLPGENRKHWEVTRKRAFEIFEKDPLLEKIFELCVYENFELKILADAKARKKFLINQADKG